MSRVLTDQVRAIVEAPLRVEKPATTLGRGFLLYFALVVAANDQGLVVRTRTNLAADLSVPDATIDEWLGRLIKTNLVRLLSPSPYLAIKLCFWSAPNLPVVEKSQATSSPDAPAVTAAAAIAATEQQQQGDRGLGEGEKLRDEVAQVLGGPDASEIADLLAHHPAPAVRKALVEVQKTPAHRIRKSRLALFRFLLAKFSQEIDVNDL